MHKLDRILLATDFSESAENAGKLAADLALTYQAELHVFFAHVTPPVQWSGALREGSGATIATMDQSSNELNRCIDTARLAVDAEPILAHGAAHKKISDLAREHGVDLLVMGTTGRSRLERSCP